MLKAKKQSSEIHKTKMTIGTQKGLEKMDNIGPLNSGKGEYAPEREGKLTNSGLGSGYSWGNSLLSVYMLSLFIHKYLPKAFYNTNHSRSNKHKTKILHHRARILAGELNQVTTNKSIYHVTC